MSIKLLFSFTLITLLAAANLYAQDFIEDDLGGFDIQEVVVNDLDGFLDYSTYDDTTIDVLQVESRFSLSGNVAFKTAYGYRDYSVSDVDYSGVNQAQTSIYLQLDTKISDDWKMRISGDAFYDAIYDIKSDNDYNDNTLDTYKTQLRLDDTYLQGKLTNDLDLKVGRQIVVWGKSDSIRVTDVINPIDNRLPGMTDIEDLRLSTTMAKLDYYVGEWNLSAMAIGESRIFLEAAPNSFIELVEPNSSFDNMQYAFGANGVFSGWDLSFYASHVYDSKWHIEGSKRIVSQIDMLGTAINIATGSWLLKSEIAYLDGVKYNSTTDDKNRLDTLVGVDYMGVSDTVLSLEIVNRHIFDHEDDMSSATTGKDFVDEDEYQTAMRATRSFSNDTINATALVSMFGSSWEYGGFARIWAEYEVMDAVGANFGVVDYIDGDKPFISAIKDNDRIFADITYSF